MSKISDASKKEYTEKVISKERHEDEIVKNFMNGDSYTCNPITTLKLVTASSIYGEPSYYRNGGIGKDVKSGLSKVKDGLFWTDSLVEMYSVLDKKWNGKKTSQVMEGVIDEALNFDFESTILWAVELRTNYNMRLNPQVIMTRAAMNPNREKFTKDHPGMFDKINQQVMLRADDPMSQLAYYIYINHGKNNIPSVLKRSIAKKLSSLSRYQVAKYKNHELGMKNATFITHAYSPVLDELVKTDTVKVNEDQLTWENLRSQGKDWKTIFNSIQMGHMALLRNLRGVFTEVHDLAFCEEYLKALKTGVKTGKQFPFRYYSAYNAIEDSNNCNHMGIIMDALEDCIDISLDNLPHINGKTMCLSDNSGSAWGSFNSEYGSVTVGEIDNLSSTILASVSDEGYVGIFGDKLEVVPVSKRNGILTQAKEMNKYCNSIGGGTENGIWLFFRDAIDKKQHWDNIIIFSDQQAGHGGLFGTDKDMVDCRKRGFCTRKSAYGGQYYINVMDLIIEYRKKVNPKVNIMSVQTAGYDNVVIPENIYRGTISYGWTGKEALMLKATTDIWDEVESKNN